MPRNFKSLMQEEPFKHNAMKIQSDSISISNKVLEHDLFENIGYHTHDTPPVKEEGRPSHKNKASKVPARLTFDLHHDITRQQKRHEILQLQMDEFHKILRDCRNKKIKRIELIHGGDQNTPLRNSIWAVLKSHYGKNARWWHPVNNPGTTEIDF
jgi:hypothetical protein